MPERWLALLFAAWLLALPGTAGAGRFDEVAAITASAATATQTSAVIVKPQGAKGVWTYLDVTAGSTLLLDVNIEASAPGSGDFVSWFSDCPSDGGVTGVGGVATSACIWAPGSTNNDYAVTVDDMVGFMPTLFRFSVEHGNATASTYVLYYQWIW